MCSTELYKFLNRIVFAVFLQHLPCRKIRGQFVFVQSRSDFNVVEVFWPESVPCDISCVSWAAEIHCGPPSCGHANTFKSILEPPTLS